MARRSRRVRPVLCSILCAIGARSVSGQSAVAAARFPARAVHVAVDVTPAGVRVRERFELAEEPRDRSFRVLTEPCTPIGDVVIRRDGRPVRLTYETRGPWLTLRDTGAPTGTAGAYEVEYAATATDAEPRIPLVVPMTPFADDSSLRARGAVVEVRFESSVRDGRVILPRMEPQSDARHWQGRYLALPSFVRLSVGAGGATCARARAGADTGGLPARFLTFVAVLVLWVPLYLWWVSRDRDVRPTANG